MVFSTPDMKQVRCIDIGARVRAVDCFNGQMLVGTKDGQICIMSEEGANKCAVMESHNDGEVWGLALTADACVVTSGDDNKIMKWDPEARKNVACMEITSDKKDLKGASSQSSKPSSQQGRAVCMFNGCMVVACNDGCVRVKSCTDGADQQVLKDSREWIQVLAPSPDGTKLAVGSHDNHIYVYDASYNCIGKCTGHSSYITAVDWSEDSKTMRSNCGAYELLFWNEDCSQDPSGRTNYQNTTWASHTAKMAWTVEGIYPKGADGTYVNSVCATPDGEHILTGDDSRLWRVFNNPARFNHKPKCYRGHSEFVQGVITSADGSRVYTVGGQDMTMMQWKKC